MTTLNASTEDISSIASNTKVVDATSTDVKDMQGLFYTVQVGVFGKPVTQGPLLQMQPLFRSTTSGGLLKYPSGFFTDVLAAIAHRDNVRETVSGAFIVAYNNGGRISINDAKNIESADGENVFSKAPTGATKTVVKTAIKKEIEDHEASANEVYFKVQIGTYKSNLTEEGASLFFKLAGNYGLDHYNNASGAKVYTIGAFKKYKNAVEEKKRINSNGITDAFIVAFHGKKRISISEATRILRAQ